MMMLPHNYVQLQHSAICQETNHVYASIGQSRDERKLCHCRTLEDSPLSIFSLSLFVVLVPAHTRRNLYNFLAETWKHVDKTGSGTTVVPGSR